MIKKYVFLWMKLTTQSFQSVLSNRLGSVLFLLGKILRFSFFLLLIFSLFTKTKTLGQYTGLEATIFFLSFNILDTVTQLLFREVYRFRHQVVSGDFDLTLVKPMSALFRSLIGGADPLDLLMLFPYTVALLIAVSRIEDVAFWNIVVYVALLLNGLLLSAGFHVMVLALAIVTTEIDHAIMIYRDLSSMGRLPVDIYREPIRSVLLFVVPVGIMMTVPVKALLSLMSFWGILGAFLIGISFFILSLIVWRYAIRQYSSASS